MMHGFTVGLIATVLVGLAMAPSGRRLKPGIVAFELARDQDAADVILRAWGPAGVAAARTNTLIDFALIAAYVTTLLGLGLGTLPAVATAFGADASVMAVFIVAAPVIAGLCDIAEDVLMLRTLAGRPPSVASTTRALALVKFALIGLSVGWGLLVGLPVLLVGAA